MDALVARIEGAQHQIVGGVSVGTVRAGNGRIRRPLGVAESHRQRAGVTAMRLRAMAAVVVLTALGIGVTPALAQRGPEFLRVEWDSKAVRRLGWVLEGTVHNASIYRVGLIRLRIEVMNETGQVIAEGGATLYDEAPANGSVHFSVPLPRTGTSYRVSVVSAVRALGGGR